MTHYKYPDSSLCGLDETQLLAKLADHKAAAADRSADVDGIARAQDLARQARDILFSRGFSFDPNETRKLQFLDWHCTELKRGFFLTFEGIDGSGKSSHLQCARMHLEASGVEVVVTREPGGTELAESIRGLFLGHVMSAHTKLYSRSPRDAITLSASYGQRSRAARGFFVTAT